MNINAQSPIPFILFVVVGIILFCKLYKKEKFTDSGLNMSDRRCMEMVGYYKPYDNNPENRVNYENRICSPLRKKIIDEQTGNYFNSYGGYTLPVNHMNSKYI